MQSGTDLRLPPIARATSVACMVVMGLANALPARAQDDHPAQRLSSIVGVAVGEYAKGVDENGKLISAEEHSEATGFLRDASEVAGRLPGKRAEAARAVLDTLIVAADADRPPHEIAAIYRRFAAALGSEGALELPAAGIDAAAGAVLYAQNCATCHGASGRGDGPAAKGLSTGPPAIGTAAEMHGVSPALMYRIVSVGVRGTAMPAWTAMTPSQRWNVVAYVTSLRATPAQVHAGEGLYFQRCASCHGATGAGGGTYARDLTTLPPEIGRLAWQGERSDSQLTDAIVEGVPASAMPPSRDLSAAELASLVAYVRTLPGKPGQSTALVATSPAPPADSTSAAGIAAHVMALVNEALVDARGGRMNDASDRAFDSYIAFEPLETPARAKNPGLVSALERQFADFKGAIKISDLRVADRARDAIQLGLPEIVQLTQPTGGGWSAFLQSFLIILREGFEAILVVGAVVAFLIKTGHRDRLPAIWKGTALGLLASGITAVILATVLRALPASREILEGATLLVAVCVLFSVSYWLISRVEAARWQQFIREKVNTALEHGGGQALAFVAFLAVYREGAETALFYQALFNEGGHTVIPLTLGIVAGFAALGVIFTLFYRFGVRIPLRPFFTVTSALLYYMAFVFAGKGVRELQEGGAVPITLLSGFPHVELMGIFPSVETLLAQFVLIALFVFALAKTFWPKRSVTLPTVAAGAGDNGASPAVPRAAAAGDIDQRLGALQSAIDALQQRVVAMEEQARTR
jgi:high-affinity iron transporter